MEIPYCEKNNNTESIDFRLMATNDNEFVNMKTFKCHVIILSSFICVFFPSGSNGLDFDCYRVRGKVS